MSDSGLTVWKFPSRSLSGECMTLSGVGLALIGLGRLGTFGPVDAGWLALIAGGLLLALGIHWLRTPYLGAELSRISSGSTADVFYGEHDYAAYSHGAGDDLNHPDVRKIMARLHDPRDPKKEWAQLHLDSLVFDSTGALSGYKIQAVKSGYFTSKRNRTDTSNRLTKALYGEWAATFDEITDICEVSKRVPFPMAVAPPPLRMVASVEEAIASYSDAHWEFGVAGDGKAIRSKMSSVPHVALIATTGGGKSIMSSTLIEQLRPSFGCVLFDGKGSDYPKSLGQLANVIALAKNVGEYMVYIRWLWDEMNERYVEADRRKATGRAGEAFDFPPLFVIIDELPSLRGQVAQADFKDKGETFDFYVNDLLQKGRQSRIHLCLVSQSLRADALPMWWQENLGQVIFLGRVSSRSLMSDMIPDEVKDTVASMSQSIPETEKGRGVFLMKEGGAVQPVEFKGYFGWSPGSTVLEKAPTPEVRAAWEVASRDCDHIVSLYDRIGIKVDDAEWRKLPMKEMVEIPTIVVADEKGPIPENEKYDPLSAEFVGNEKIVIGERARGRGSVARS